MISGLRAKFPRLPMRPSLSAAATTSASKSGGGGGGLPGGRSAPLLRGDRRGRRRFFGGRVSREGLFVSRDLLSVFLLVGGLFLFAQSFEGLAGHFRDGTEALLTLGLDGLCELLALLVREDTIRATDRLLRRLWVLLFFALP